MIAIRTLSIGRMWLITNNDNNAVNNVDIKSNGESNNIGNKNHYSRDHFSNNVIIIPKYNVAYSTFYNKYYN